MRILHLDLLQFAIKLGILLALLHDVGRRVALKVDNLIRKVHFRIYSDSGLYL
jgi:hypothetical protein